ncbi:MAG TPA: hypothetical protein VMV43_05280 [Candidatus Nanopelagicaceae bacterium]|nr:hypothetical protein [Candidatus Nanopelagicaceae bacterium]
MNERNFQIFLEENEIDNSIIKNFLSKLRDYENFLKKENLSLDSVNPKKLVDYTEYLVSINQDSVLDFLRAILSYANYSKKYDFITETIDIVESYNAMDTLFSRIAEIHGEQMRNEIFRGLVIPPLGVHPEKKPNFTKNIMKRLEDNLGKEDTIALLSPCLHGRPPDDIEGDKKILAELGIDGFLLKKHHDLIERLEKHRDEGTLEFAQIVDDEVIEFVRNNQMLVGIRKGNTIYTSKVPYQTKKFLTAKDKKMEKFYLCYCPWIRGALKEGTDNEILKNFCHCSAGWYKLYWDQIFEQSIIVDPIKTGLYGDLECSFAVHIPEKIINNKK